MPDAHVYRALKMVCCLAPGVPTGLSVCRCGSPLLPTRRQGSHLGGLLCLSAFLQAPELPCPPSSCAHSDLPPCIFKRPSEGAEGGGGSARTCSILDSGLPPVWRRVVCWSERTSTRQNNKILVSGTIGAFRLCSDKRLDQFSDLQPCLFPQAIAQALQVLHLRFFNPAKPAAVLLQPPSKLCNANNNAN